MSERPTEEQQEKLNALRAVAAQSNSDFTVIVGRDKNAKLVDVGVLARGRDAAELLAWIKRKERKRK